MGQVLLFACGGGLLSAMLFVSAASGSPSALIVTQLTPLPLFLVGFTLGASATAVASVVAVATVLVFAGLVPGAGLMVGVGLPVILLMRQAMTAAGSAGSNDADSAVWCPPGPLLVVLCGYGAALVAAAATATMGRPGGLEGVIGGMVASKQDVLASLAGPDAEMVVARLVDFAPGILAVGWMLALTATGALGHWIVGRFGLSRRSDMAMSDIELPGWMVVVLAVLVAGAYLLDGQIGYVARNLAVVVGFGFFFAGLGVLHALMRASQSRPLWLAALYGLLVLQGWTALFVAGLGVIDQWAGLRRRATSTGPGVED